MSIRSNGSRAKDHQTRKDNCDFLDMVSYLIPDELALMQKVINLLPYFGDSLSCAAIGELFEKEQSKFGGKLHSSKRHTLEMIALLSTISPYQESVNNSPIGEKGQKLLCHLLKQYQKAKKFFPKKPTTGGAPQQTPIDQTSASQQILIDQTSASQQTPIDQASALVQSRGLILFQNSNPSYDDDGSTNLYNIYDDDDFSQTNNFPSSGDMPFNESIDLDQPLSFTDLKPLWD